MRSSNLAVIVAVVLSLCLSGCGKIPTWGELTGQTPPPATTTTTPAPQPVAPVVQAVQPPAPPSPAEIIGKFQALRPAEINDQHLQNLLEMNEGLELLTDLDATGASGLTSSSFNKIEKLTGLQRLTLTATRVDDQACAHIAMLSSLESLALNDTQISDVGVAALAGLKNLKHLEMTRCRLTENGFSALGNFPALTSVVLDSTNMDNRKLNLLCNAKTITSMKLPRNRFDDYGLEALKKLDELQYLELGETQCSGAGLALASKGGGLKQLKFLGMFGNPLNRQGVVAISGLKSLEDISLGNINVMGDQDLSNMITGMKRLKKVYVARNENINGAGLQALKGCKDLEELYIHQCPHIGDAVVPFLKTLKTLKVLSCGSTAISAPRIAELKNALPDCRIE